MEAFLDSGIESLSIPDSVRVLGERCFAHCPELKHVTFGAGSQLERIDEDAFKDTSIAQINAPEHLRGMLMQRCHNARFVPVN